MVTMKAIDDRISTFADGNDNRISSNTKWATHNKRKHHEIHYICLTNITQNPDNSKSLLNTIRNAQSSS